jgi:hypothetical protein
MEDYKKKYEEVNKKVAIRFGSDVARELFSDLYESEDERIRKNIVATIKQCPDDFLNPKNRDRMLEWLEKQGNQSHWKPTEEQLQTLHTQLNEGAVTYPDDKRVLTTLYEDLMKITTQEEKKNWQKPADKVEPKFHEGDWVVSNPELCFESPLCIKDIDNNNYRVESVDGCSGVPTINYLDNYYHLYTIKDAKDGDVLVYEGEIFLIKYYVLWHKIVYYCCYDGKNLHKLSIYDSWKKDDFTKVHPATKEQRDLLFQKMKEAGYEWDADKKELKKIDPCSGCTNDKGCINCENGSLKETEKSAWSKEDKEQLDRAIYMMGQLGLTKSWDDVYNWLKSLKDRI